MMASMEMQARAGAMDAGRLFRDHATFVASFLARLGVGSSDLDDLVQEVFMTAHRLGGFVPEQAKPTTWLAHIAVRVASNHRRARSRRRHVGDDGVLAMVPSGGGSPEEDAAAAQALVRVAEALRGMDIEHRAVFVLYELEGESCAEIAAGLSLPVGTVHSRLHAARRKFQKAHRRAMRRSRGGGGENGT